MPKQVALTKLANEIASCRICDTQRIPVEHAPVLNRGLGNKGIMIVGIEPGNTENKTGEAFSGLAGRTLFQWLSKAGLGTSREEIMQACYFTSIRKCRVRNRAAAKAANRNCFRYLAMQVEELQPKCILLLGKEPLEALVPAALFPEAIGKRLSPGEVERDLFAIFPKDSVVISLPHPSPLNRWMNSSENKAILERAIGEIRKCAE